MEHLAIKSTIYFIVLLGLSGCGYEAVQNAQGIPAVKTTPTIQMARKINIGQLQQELTRLKNRQTEYDFVGITSNGVDCIYFVPDGDKFDLEFEAMISEQLPYIEKLRQWAGSNHFETSMTTYDNKPKYPSERPAPVIHIETNASIETAAKLGRQIEKEIFGNSDGRIYEVVP